MTNQRELKNLTSPLRLPRCKCWKPHTLVKVEVLLMRVVMKVRVIAMVVLMVEEVEVVMMILMVEKIKEMMMMMKVTMTIMSRKKMYIHANIRKKQNNKQRSET